MNIMLIIKIVVTVLAAALSFPVFPYFIFKNIIRKEKYNAISTENAENLWFWLFFGWFVLFSIGWSIANLYDCREVWDTYLVPMIFPIILQFIYALIFMKRNLLKIALPILTIAFLLCIAMPIRNSILSYEPKMETKSEEILIDIPKPILSEKQIEVILDAESVALLTYNDDKYIYEIKKNDEGFGFAIVDTKHLQYISCKFENDIKTLRQLGYKSEEIAGCGIEIDFNVEHPIPYAKFGILKRPGIFSRPEIDFYVLLNMKTGKTTKLEK